VGNYHRLLEGKEVEAFAKGFRFAVLPEMGNQTVGHDDVFKSVLTEVTHPQLIVEHIPKRLVNSTKRLNSIGSIKGTWLVHLDIKNGRCHTFSQSHAVGVACGTTVVPETARIAAHNSRTRLTHPSLGNSHQRAWFEIVVAVDPVNYIAGYTLQPLVDGVGLSPVWFANPIGDAAAEALYHLHGIVGASAIDNNILEIGISLIEN